MLSSQLCRTSSINNISSVPDILIANYNIICKIKTTASRRLQQKYKDLVAKALPMWQYKTNGNTEMENEYSSSRIFPLPRRSRTCIVAIDDQQQATRHDDVQQHMIKNQIQSESSETSCAFCHLVFTNLNSAQLGMLCYLLISYLLQICNRKEKQ